MRRSNFESLKSKNYTDSYKKVAKRGNFTDNKVMKKLEIKKRMFNRGNKTEKMSLSLPRNVLLGLKQMEEITGVSAQDQILDLCEQYLSQCVEDGEIQEPSHGETMSSLGGVTSVAASVKTKVS